MKGDVNNITEKVFYFILIVYLILITLSAFGFFWKYSFRFEIFAFITAIFGISIISKQELIKNDSPNSKNKKYHFLLILSALFFIFLIRIIPYINNSIPLGYDAGIYKYGVEKGLQNLDEWILTGGLEPGFLYLAAFLKTFFSTNFILTYLLIFFCIITGTIIYITTSKYWNKKVGLIALFLYSISLIQFKTFVFMYYKNILGIILILFSFYLYESYEKEITIRKRKLLISLFIITGAILASIHRPSFYIFGIVYTIYSIVSPYEKNIYHSKKLFINFLIGLSMIILGLLFYIGSFSSAITNMIEPVLEGFVNTGESPGTFINILTYQYSILFYLPFAIMGLFYQARKREFNLIFFFTIITGIIVYFEYFFFNRFIIFLDIGLIITSSLSLYLIMKENKLGILIPVIVILFSGFLIVNESIDTKPLINENELAVIEHLNNTETDSFVMSTSSIYSTWILGYSNRTTIAPGLFDYNQNSLAEWEEFWITEDINYIKYFMNPYKTPLYIFIGEKQKDNLKSFPECFTTYYEKENNRIYEYVC